MRLQRDPSGDYVLDSSFLAERLNLTCDALQRRMRLGQVTSRVEEGTGADAGRIRLTLTTSRLTWTAVLNQRGDIIEEAVTVTR